MATGIERIAAERKRQIEVEGWTPEHDAQHGENELLWAAVSYATPDNFRLAKLVTTYRNVGQVGEDRWQAVDVSVPNHWPWQPEWWRPTPKDRIRELEKAGALIAAEIDRLLVRAQP